MRFNTLLNTFCLWQNIYNYLFGLLAIVVSWFCRNCSWVEIFVQKTMYFGGNDANQADFFLISSPKSVWFIKTTQDQQVFFRFFPRGTEKEGPFLFCFFFFSLAIQRRQQLQKREENTVTWLGGEQRGSRKTQRKERSINQGWREDDFGTMRREMRWKKLGRAHLEREGHSKECHSWKELQLKGATAGKSHN